MLALNAISRRRTRISYCNAASPARAPPGAHHRSRTGGRRDRDSRITRTRQSAHVSSPLSRPSGTARNTRDPPLQAGQAP